MDKIEVIQADRLKIGMTTELIERPWPPKPRRTLTFYSVGGVLRYRAALKARETQHGQG